jgi:antitoxin (DNA-binding transcriptional repressor) of toxin-antitoxin stability system
MSITASALRQDVYRLLDRVLQTGVPLEIERHGRTLRIVADPPSDKLDRLVPHPGFVLGRLDALAEAGWESAWDGEPELDLAPTHD